MQKNEIFLFSRYAFILIKFIDSYLEKVVNKDKENISNSSEYDDIPSHFFAEVTTI